MLMTQVFFAWVILIKLCVCCVCFCMFRSSKMTNTRVSSWKYGSVIHQYKGLCKIKTFLERYNLNL